MRRSRLVSSVLFGLALLVPGGAGLGPVHAQGKPIKIGFLAPLTGAAAQIGRDMENGFRMYLEETGHQMAGRKVEVIVEDTAGNPGTAITKFRKFVESDRVDMVVGETFAHIGYALAPKAEEYKMPTIFPVIAADDLTQRKPSKWVVRLGWTGSQPSHPFGEYAARTLGYKRVAVFGTDYAFGYEVVGGFQRAFEEAGGQVIQKLWAPLGTTDLAPYLSQIKRDADAAFIIVVAASALRFPTHYQDAGLKGRLPVIGGAVIVDESVLPTFGDEALGMITPLMYSAALDTPANRRFVAEYRKRYGKVPSYFSETCYTSGRWIAEAAKAVGGRVEDREKFMAAFRGVEIPDAPRGPLKLDAWGNRLSVFYDLTKTAAIRMAWAHAKDLAPHGATAVSITPGWMRSEMMLGNYDVTEENWRDAIAKSPHFVISESPRFVGRAVAALAADPARARWTGQSLSSGGLARIYGFTDVDGSRPDCWRYITEVQEAGKAADATGYR